MEGKKQLTTWQASCIIAGYGVGSGIMTLPFLVEKTGIIWGIVILAAAFFFSYIMHMMLAELALSAEPGSQVVSIFTKYLFRGKYGKVLLYGFFTVAILMLSKLVFYVFAALIVLFGLKILGMSESISIIAIIAIVAALAVGSMFHLTNPLPLKSEGVKQVMAYFGMAMFALTAFFSIPQAVYGLGNDKKKVRTAVLTGMGINGGFMVVIILCALASSSEITELAMIGWAGGIGSWAKWLGYAFTLLAMLTTYWSLSLALSDIVKDQFKWPAKLCWLVATLPSLLLVVFDFSSFLSLMRTAGGLIAILISLLVIPAFRRSRRENGEVLLSAPMGGRVMQILVLAAYVMMAAGSAVAI